MLSRPLMVLFFIVLKKRMNERGGMLTYIYIAAGGALGSVSRVALSSLFPSHLMGMPTQIFFINVLGCFGIGALTEIFTLYWNISPQMRGFWVSGFLGGFTTFSAFALEFGLLFEKGQVGMAIFLACISVVASLLFFFLGMKLVNWL